MGASSFPGLKFKKGAHASVVIEAVRKQRRSRDERGSDEARDRSGGKCEIKVIGEPTCRVRAAEIHHMIGGRMRGRGASALAQHKQHACERHHKQITGELGNGKTLERVGDPQTPWFTDKYRRLR